MDVADVQTQIRERSPLPRDETEALIAARFGHVPRRLNAALRQWPLDRSSVLDVGCSYGMCLIHFGPGSMGIDNSVRASSFARAIGLDVVTADVETSLSSLPSRRFDYLWVSDIVEHLEAPRRLLRSLAELVAPDGSLLLQTSVLPRSRLAAAALRRLGERPFDAEVHYNQWTLDTLAHLLTRAGFAPRRVLPLLPVPKGMSSRVIVEARLDAGLVARADRAVARNHSPDAA